MSSLFSPKMPTIPEAPKPPTTDDARQAEEDLMMMRRRRGRASTFLTGPASAPRKSASGSLLGQSGTTPAQNTRKTSPATPSRAMSA